MTKSREALELFKQDFNCTQSILGTFCTDFGYDKDTFIKIATPLGAGMARNQQTCGAVTGAMLVLGMKYGTSDSKDIDSKEICYEIVNEFIDRFMERNKSISCMELLGVDMNTEEGMNIIEEDNLYETKCTKLIASSIVILDDILGNGEIE